MYVQFSGTFYWKKCQSISESELIATREDMMFGNLEEMTRLVSTAVDNELDFTSAQKGHVVPETGIMVCNVFFKY